MLAWLSVFLRPALWQNAFVSNCKMHLSQIVKNWHLIQWNAAEQMPAWLSVFLCTARCPVFTSCPCFYKIAVKTLHRCIPIIAIVIIGKIIQNTKVSVTNQGLFMYTTWRGSECLESLWNEYLYCLFVCLDFKNHQKWFQSRSVVLPRGSNFIHQMLPQDSNISYICTVCLCHRNRFDLNKKLHILSQKRPILLWLYWNWLCHSADTIWDS